MTDETNTETADNLVGETNAEFTELLGNLKSYQRLRLSEYNDRKLALNDAFKFVYDKIRPWVDDDIAKLRADESLEPRPGYVVSGTQAVNQVLPIAYFLMGIDLVSEDKYFRFETHPKRPEAKS